MPLLIAALIILVIFAVFFIAQFYDSVFRGYAPFISTQNTAVKRILAELEGKDMPDGAAVYELGCGDAGFLRAMEGRRPGLELVGIEYSFLPYLISRMQVSLLKSRIKVIKQDFFQTDLRNADMIYCYLSVESMARLADKFREECRPGTLIISNRFTLPKFEPEKVLAAEDGSDRGKVYFYRV